MTSWKDLQAPRCSLQMVMSWAYTVTVFTIEATDCVKELAESTRALAELWENTHLAASGISPDAGPRLRIPPFELGDSRRSLRLNRIPVDTSRGHSVDRGSGIEESVIAGDSDGPGEGDS